MGYIKLFRKIQDWGWYDDPNTLALWVHLLVDANWKDNAEWHGEPIERGALITSVAKISADTGLSDRQVRTALSHLVSTGEIVMKATNKWTKITVCKYDTYQSASTDECQADDEQATSNRQAGDKQPTTLKESNKGKKKEGKNIYAEAVDRIYNLYPAMTTRADGTKSSLRTAKKDKDKIERLLSSGEYTEESLSYAIRRYLSETKPEYLKQLQTFLNQIPDYSDNNAGLFQEKKWKMNGARYTLSEMLELAPDNHEFLAVPPEIRMALRDKKEVIWNGERFIVAEPEESK